MSASAATIAQKLPQDSSTRPVDPPKLRFLEWAVRMPVLALVCALTASHWHQIVRETPSLLPWIALVCLVDLIPLRYASHLLTMSIAILLAVGMTYTPVEAGLVAVLGSVDWREFRREVGLERALFNRGQVALSVMAASFVFHVLGATISSWPLAIA